MGISCGWGPGAGSCGIWWINKKMATIDLLSGFRLTGKRALITGAGGGIGRALVALFQAAGASVMGADIRASAMDGLELDDRLVFDLTDPDAIEAAVAPLEGAGKAPDILVSNAGFTRSESLDKVDRAVWDKELAINLSGAFHVAKPVVAAMARAVLTCASRPGPPGAPPRTVRSRAAGGEPTIATSALR